MADTSIAKQAGPAAMKLAGGAVQPLAGKVLSLGKRPALDYEKEANRLSAPNVSPLERKALTGGIAKHKTLARETKQAVKGLRRK